MGIGGANQGFFVVVYLAVIPLADLPAILALLPLRERGGGVAS